MSDFFSGFGVGRPHWLRQKVGRRQVVGSVHSRLLVREEDLGKSSTYFFDTSE